MIKKEMIQGKVYFVEISAVGGLPFSGHCVAVENQDEFIHIKFRQDRKWKCAIYRVKRINVCEETSLTENILLDREDHKFAADVGPTLAQELLGEGAEAPF